MVTCGNSSGFASGLTDLAANISEVTACGLSDLDVADVISVSFMQPTVVVFFFMALVVAAVVVTFHSKQPVHIKPGEKVLWHISGADYDLSSFVNKHPGGPIAIGLGRGIDCTRLFMTYHAPNGRAHAMLERYRVGSEQGTPLPKSEFHAALCEMVKTHFKGQGKFAHKATYLHLAFLTVCVMAMISSWWAWFSGLWFSLLTLPVSAWLVFTNGVHDASHFAMSSVAWVNHAMCFTALPLFLNPITWYSQHVVEHHCHCNEIGLDVDLHHFMPLRLHKLEDSAGSLGNLAKTMLTGMHLGIGVPLNALTGVLQNSLPDGFIHGCDIKLLYVFRESLSHYLSMWSSLLMAYFCLVMSFFVHDTLLKKVCFLVVPYVLASLLFMVFTQVSHIQEECQTDETLEKEDFFVRQARTSLDYSVDSKLWSILSGGLNMQSLHHSMPWVNSCHYTAIYPKFVEVCRQHGAQPPSVPNLASALHAGFNYIVKLNDPMTNSLKAN
mmetsp:Transcript_9677/g.17414  ORF Transcript_9677/g.17414 Transcript_9677/m.17414 type:complete len:496 (+) Transcript_9677:109-1596(+)|eukprot:CAMPEP_0197661232 /NCGR_PEP_ID=MMETSP1338-20131121/51332_1 /TAXON_ID=43686 ORGANISM="Pelagodinium beii, Strain RCC1491" /NCGR_SAMPLE_ID=MMETSP1338 /ASSEMBLY_ACC=CAM_ASM_000754 /LENGTH=495 /DNA_ID=CAMNT_0043238749 /DNA_START=21 /DNA_END=1508 /DNA_ORIENTATION=+